MIEKVYVKEISNNKEEEELDEKTWSIFQCDEIGAISYLKGNKYILEAYFEDKDLCKICEQRLKKLGFKKQGDNMELVDVNVVVKLGEPQFAIGNDKIIGYDELEVCGECGAIIRDKTHKYCTQCGTQVRVEDY